MLSSQSLDPWFHLRPVLLGSMTRTLPVGDSLPHWACYSPHPLCAPTTWTPWLLLRGSGPPREFMSGTPKLDPLSPKL